MEPPDKVMIPTLVPVIRQDDPRLFKISERIRGKLLDPGVGITQESLEFEIKIGNIGLKQ